MNWGSISRHTSAATPITRTTGVDIFCVFSFLNKISPQMLCTDCCAKHGVVYPYAYCQDLCDGTDDIKPDPKYYECEKISIRAAVSRCNEKAYGPGGSDEMPVEMED
jgi:hypothetical protein